MGNGISARLKTYYHAVREFLTEKWIVTHEEEQVSRLRRFGLFWLLVFKSFTQNRCPVRATALAYTTLLALVPLLAVGVSVTTSLLQEKGELATREMIEKLVVAAAPQLQLVSQADPEASVDARQEVVDRINHFISNVQFKTLGAGGMGGLIIVAILLLTTVENAFNDIWGVTRGRSWFKRVVQYWTTISLGPIALVLSGVLVGSAYLGSTQSFLETLPFLGKYLYKSLPFILISCAFAVFYKLMPNTHVHLGAALVGGMMGGSLWLLLNIANALFLARVMNMSKIYGAALGLVPIFLVGLYFSWLILLFGSQVAYVFQNRLVYFQEKKAESVNQRGREFVALRVMVHLAQKYERGEAPPTLLQIARALAVPSRLIGMVIMPLTEARLVLEVDGEDEAYAPARPLESITCHDVLETLRSGGGHEPHTRSEPARDLVAEEFLNINSAENRAASAVTLKDLLRRMTGPQPAAAANRLGQSIAPKARKEQRAG